MAARNKLGKGRGRPRGSKNKLPVQVKELIEGALSEAGGQRYLVTQARKNPKAFLQLVGKLIPRDLNVSGELTHTLVDLIAASYQPKVDHEQAGRDSGLTN